MLNNETEILSQTKNRDRVEIYSLITPSSEVLDALAEIYVECFNGDPWFENWDIGMAESTLRSYLDKQFTLLVARYAGEVVGLCVAAPLSAYDADSQRFADIVDINNSAYLPDVAVAPSAQGCGIGTALVAAFIEISRASGATTATLRTRENNTSAIKVFERLGFRECVRYEAETGGVESLRLGFVRSLAY